MFKQSVFSHTISYTITDQGIHLINDFPLKSLIESFPLNGVLKLVNVLQKHFEEINGRPLKITTESLKAEIWGHYYFERIYPPLRSILNFISLNKLVNKIDTSILEYDCAELGTDPNRRLWDFLSHFNFLFSRLVSDKPINM